MTTTWVCFVSTYHIFLHSNTDIHVLASAMGANNTSRTLGGCVGLAVTSAVTHSKLRNMLSAFLSPSQVSTVLNSSSTNSNNGLSPSDLVRVRYAYAVSYGAQFQALLAFACVGTVSAVALGILREQQVRRTCRLSSQSRATTFIQLDDQVTAVG